ncbi:hypothetical protein [Streptomyces sp. NPDC006996]|uniref:hypothetical protein n=1 Tax=Streptomyces sp. NPDC006996 TaxID=3156908 RepID=UPI0033EC4485
MALEPWEATILAASVTSVVSTVAVLLTHRLTRKRDREFRVWERRMDTYSEVVRIRQELGRMRHEVLETKSPPSRPIDPDHDSRAFGLTQAKLKMFGSEKIKNLDLLSSNGFIMWMEAVSAWKEIGQADTATQEEHDEAWQQVVGLARACADFDRVLVKAIEDAAEFKKTPWWTPKLRKLRRRVKAKLRRPRPEPQELS